MRTVGQITHECPGRCGCSVPYARLSCPPCWFRLPKPMRDEVNAAWARRASDPIRHLRAIDQARRWYRGAS